MNRPNPRIWQYLLPDCTTSFLSLEDALACPPDEGVTLLSVQLDTVMTKTELALAAHGHPVDCTWTISERAQEALSLLDSHTASGESEVCIVRCALPVSVLHAVSGNPDLQLAIAESSGVQCSAPLGLLHIHSQSYGWLQRQCSPPHHRPHLRHVIPTAFLCLDRCDPGRNTSL